MNAIKVKFLFLLPLFFFPNELFTQQKVAVFSGRILTAEKEPVEFATVYLKGTGIGVSTNGDGQLNSRLLLVIISLLCRQWAFKPLSRS